MVNVSKRITTVLFDFAGTLFCPLSAGEWVTAAARRSGTELSEPETEALAAAYLRVGLPGGPYPASVPEPLRSAYAERDLSRDAHRRAYVGLLSTVPGPSPTFAEALYDEVLLPGSWVPYADTRPVIGALCEAAIRIGVISNVGFDLRPILRHHGAAELADACTLSFEHGVAKPAPAIFRAALDSLGSTPGETLMVGDHAEADGAAADLGCDTLILPMSAPGATHGLQRVVHRVLGSA
jgi:FMN phosphatase YigB (HAD superfamily)